MQQKNVLAWHYDADDDAPSKVRWWLSYKWSHMNGRDRIPEETQLRHSSSLKSVVL